MKNDLSCEVVRDLLPSYVDGLTSEVTNEAVERHVEGCEACSSVLREMRGQEPPEFPEGEGTVDALKKVKRRTSRRVAAAVAGTLVLMLLVLLGARSVHRHWIGGQVEPVSWRVEVDGDAVTITGTLPEHCRFLRYQVSREPESTYEGEHPLVVKLYAVIDPGAAADTFTVRLTPETMPDRIYFGGMQAPAWVEGEQISMKTIQLFYTVTPYVGDISALNRVSLALGIATTIGGYTNELQTSQEPYGWMLNLKSPLEDADEAELTGLMERNACAMLACVEKLGYVTWNYQLRGSGEEKSLTVTLEDARELLGYDVKENAEDIAALQRLMEELKLT